MKRDWNQSADQLASAALHQQKGTEVVSKEEWPGLEAINRLSELLVPRDQSPSAKVFAMYRSRSPIRIPGEAVQEDAIQQLRVDRIRKAQDEETWVRDLSYLKEDWGDLSVDSARSCSKMSEDYEISEEGLLDYCPNQKIEGDDRGVTARLVIPESLQADILHHYHTSLEGGHQGIGRTYHRIRRYCHWRGLFRSVQKYVGL